MNNYKKYARIAGIFYLIIILGALFTQVFVRSGIIVPGNSTATANNILSSEFLFRVGFAIDLVVFLSDIAVAVIFYILLKSVNKTLAMIAASARLIMAAISGINLLNYFAPIILLSGADYLNVFETDQLNALATMFLKMHSYGYHIALIFFGIHCLVLGYLLFKSENFPKTLGILMVIASIGYLVNSFSAVLFPGFAVHLFPYILLPAFIAELSLCFWLLIVGQRVH